MMLPLTPQLFTIMIISLPNKLAPQTQMIPIIRSKHLAALDNTCRVPLGFQAVGNEPLGCYVNGGEVEANATPTADGPNSTCGQFVELCSKVK